MSFFFIYTKLLLCLLSCVFFLIFSFSPFLLFSFSNSLFEPKLLELVPLAVNISRFGVASYVSTLHSRSIEIPFRSTCNDWIDDQSETLWNDESRMFGCNPANRTQRSDTRLVYYDSTSIYVAVILPVLLLFVLWHGDERPYLEYSSRREAVGRYVSLFMGMLAGCFIFLGGINLERASLLQPTSLSTDPGLSFWSAWYLLVAALTFRHSLMLLLPAKYTLPSDVVRVAASRATVQALDPETRREKRMLQRAERRRGSSGGRSR